MVGPNAPHFRPEELVGALHDRDVDETTPRVPPKKWSARIKRLFRKITHSRMVDRMIFRLLLSTVMMPVIFILAVIFIVIGWLGWLFTNRAVTITTRIPWNLSDEWRVETK